MIIILPMVCLSNFIIIKRGIEIFLQHKSRLGNLSYTIIQINDVYTLDNQHVENPPAMLMAELRDLAPHIFMKYALHDA